MRFFCILSKKAPTYRISSHNHHKSVEKGDRKSVEKGEHKSVEKGVSRGVPT